MELQTISASKIKTYRTCAKKYYYTYKLAYKDRPEQEKNIGALYGTALHEAIEQRYRTGANPVFVFDAEMNRIHEEWSTKGYIIRGEEWLSKFLKDGRKILKEFDWNRFNPLELEYSFVLPFPNTSNPIVYIEGVIDHIDVAEFIADHKSQSKLPPLDTINNDAQFIIYTWAYKELYGVMPNAVYWNNLRTNELIPIDVYTAYDKKLIRLQEDIEAMLNATHFARINLDQKVCKRECSFYELCFGES